MKKIPLFAAQQAIYLALSSYQTTPVYDDVPPGAELPFITIGAFTCKPISNKTTDIYDCTFQIHIWSEYEGKKEVNDISNDVIAVVTYPIELEDYEVREQFVDFFEAFPEETAGYHGVITLNLILQDIGG